MNIQLITPPEFEPVLLSDVYSHLRLDADPDGHPDDAMLQRHIRTARAEAERITHRALVRQKLRLTQQNFCRVDLWRPPLISVEAVRYYDSANAFQLIASDQWFVVSDDVPQLRLVDGALPALYARRDAVQIDYWAGYPAAGSPGTARDELIANVPPGVADAVLIGVQLLYDELTPEKRKALESVRASLLAPLVVPVVA